MGGGPKDIDKTPDKPFEPSDDHKVASANPAQPVPDGMTADDSTVLELAPTWGKWSQIYYPADKNLDHAPISTVAEVYKDIAGILQAGFTDMDKGMKSVLAEQWSGAGADAAQQVTQAYVANGDALHAAVLGMNVNLVNLSDVVGVTKSNLPHPDDVRSYLEKAVNDAIESANRQGHITVTTPDSADPTFTLSGNVQYSRAGGHTSVTAAQIQPLFDEAVRSVDEVAQNTMSSSFYPGLQASDRGVPAFAIAPPNTTTPPSAPPGGPGGTGSAGPGSSSPSVGGPGGIPTGSGSSGPPPSAADVAAQTRQLLETGGPGGNPAGPMPTGVDPMGGANVPGGSGASAVPGALGGVPGMSGASGASGASDAMKKAMSQGAALAGIPSPASLSGLQSKLGGLGKPGEIPALKGLSGLPHGAGAGGGGAGAGGGGGGTGAGGAGGGPLGAPKAMSDAATREASISQGLRESAAAERGAATAARAGTAGAPAGGGPMGGGGGGARGAGGEDKEHKSNKFLRSTRRGEDLLGQAPPATAAVIAPQ